MALWSTVRSSFLFPFPSFLAAIWLADRSTSQLENGFPLATCVISEQIKMPIWLSSDVCLSPSPHFYSKLIPLQNGDASETTKTWLSVQYVWQSTQPVASQTCWQRSRVSTVLPGTSPGSQHPLGAWDLRLHAAAIKVHLGMQRHVQKSERTRYMFLFSIVYLWLCAAPVSSFNHIAVRWPAAGVLLWPWLLHAHWLLHVVNANMYISYIFLL